MLPPTTRLNRRTIGVAAVAIVFAVAAATGAYAHWILWHPMDGVLIFLAAGLALLAAGAMVIALKGAARRIALMPLVVGIGLLVGQGVGPSRPALQHDEGTMTVMLERPRAATSTDAATCETVDGGSELQLGGASRLDILGDDPAIPTDVDQREFVGISLRVGDRWRDAAVHRSDDVDLLVIVGGVVADTTEVHLAADDDSVMEIDWTNDGGTLHFDRLAVDGPKDAASSDLAHLAGTISWTCRLPDATPAAIALAQATCAGSTYARCLDDLLLAMRQAPGSLVAICEYAGGEGEVVPLERESDAEAWCSADGETRSGRVVDVVLLP